jgi:hydroxyacyl-ACP dehydratase HTD2-like protein with hotdog domain
MTRADQVLSEARSLTPGRHLASAVFSPTRVTCFLFAVAWWTPHRVHYDVELARAEGYADVMVPGLLLTEYVVTALTSWTGDPTSLRQMNIRHLAPAFAGDTLTVDTEVVDVALGSDAAVIVADFTMSKASQIQVVGGRATVEVTSGRGPGR